MCACGNVPVTWILGVATWIITHLRLFTELSNHVRVQAEMCFIANECQAVISCPGSYPWLVESCSS